MGSEGGAVALVPEPLVEYFNSTTTIRWEQRKNKKNYTSKLK